MRGSVRGLAYGGGAGPSVIFEAKDGRFGEDGSESA